MLHAIIQGFLVGASLIIAIGPQNAFVINQGLKRHHVFATALTCSLSDCILIATGVLGLGTIFLLHPMLTEAARWFGVVFLTVYGLISFKSAFHPAVLKLEALAKPPKKLGKTIVTLLGLSFLNPHAYLDTFVLISSIAAQHKGLGRLLFGLGAIFASFVWFFSIAYGARVLTPIFKKVTAWRVLDIIIGCVMWAIAAVLIVMD